MIATYPSLVVLVDRHDAPVGVMDKAMAHIGDGQLHRAVSVCLFDDRHRVLLQRRADIKYHFAGRWSNACCTHPLPDEPPFTAANRCATDELGIAAPVLTYCGNFIYRARDRASGLAEWELDHVFSGVYRGTLALDPREVADVRWMEVDPSDVTGLVGDDFTPWLVPVLRRVWATHRDQRRPHGLPTD